MAPPRGQHYRGDLEALGKTFTEQSDWLSAALTLHQEGALQRRAFAFYLPPSVRFAGWRVLESGWREHGHQWRRERRG